MDQGAHVFGEARAAITAAGVDKVVADARVGTDAQAHRLNVGAQVFGQLGNLVDEADLGGQHAVGGVLGQFGAAQVHEDDAVVVAVERRVEVAHYVTHFFTLTADDDPVRAAAVGNGGAFLEEFRVGDDIELQLTAGGTQIVENVVAQGVAGTDRHRGFLHQDYRRHAMAGNRITHRQHVFQVGRTVFIRRRAHGNKQHFTVFDGEFLIVGKAQASAFQVVLDHGCQARLEDGHMTLLQRFDLALVNVHANDIVTDFG